MTQRARQIEEALTQLATFRADPAYAEQRYAIDANSAFLEAARSLPRYLLWLFTVAPRLDGSRLLELTDFPVPAWDVAMHSRLIEMQQRARPGLVAPLVRAITDHIQGADRDLVIADLGAGGMEVDRQVAAWALKENTQHKLTIVAVDKSATTRAIAQKNLATLGDAVEVREVGEMTGVDLTRLRAAATKNVLIVLCTNDIFDLASSFSEKRFDLVYHSLFRHHLTPAQQERLDNVLQEIANVRLEFDGFKSWFPHGIIQSLAGWSSTIFLNGTIISMARYQKKADVADESGEISFFMKTAHYLRRF